jgi:hypothetical protein
MNWKQKICMWIGIAVIVLMGLFPPWILKDPVDGGEAQSLKFGLLVPQLPYFDWDRMVWQQSYAYQIHVVQLVIQWFMVAVVTGGLVVTFADKKPKEEQKQ